MSKFAYTEDGDILHVKTGLVIMGKACPRRLRFDEAVAFLAGSKWRLPKKKELKILYKAGRITAGVPIYHYWSGTTSAGIPSNAWVVNLSNRMIYTCDKEAIHYVLPVRSVQ